jgi:hypothetical protein
MRALTSAGILVAAVALLGCGARWHRPGTSDETFLVDRLECREEARVWQPRGDGLVETWRIDPDSFELCMRRRGYTREKRASVPRADAPPMTPPPPAPE